VKEIPGIWSWVPFLGEKWKREAARDNERQEAEASAARRRAEAAAGGVSWIRAWLTDLGKPVEAVVGAYRRGLAVIEGKMALIRQHAEAIREYTADAAAPGDNAGAGRAGAVEALFKAVRLCLSQVLGHAEALLGCFGACEGQVLAFLTGLSPDDRAVWSSRRDQLKRGEYGQRPSLAALFRSMFAGKEARATFGTLGFELPPYEIPDLVSELLPQVLPSQASGP